MTDDKTSQGSPALNTLPTAARHSAAERKYSKAVAIYASTNLSLKEISSITGVPANGLGAYIRRHHRDLIIARNNIEQLPTKEKIKSPKGQSYVTQRKYEGAIETCASPDFIEYNLSEIANMFDLNPTALSSQLKTHFPEILKTRNDTRDRLGLSENRQRGAKPESILLYKDAIELYSGSDLTIPEIAERCNVSPGGLGQFIRFYHKDLMEKKAQRRLKRREERKNPTPVERKQSREGTMEKYREAVESLRQHPRPVAKAASEFGFNPDVFRVYIKRHHPELCGDSEAKYMEAIREYAESKRPMKEIAAERGLVYKSLMSYMKRNCPEAIKKHKKQ